MVSNSKISERVLVWSYKMLKKFGIQLYFSPFAKTILTEDPACIFYSNIIEIIENWIKINIWQADTINNDMKGVYIRAPLEWKKCEYNNKTFQVPIQILFNAVLIQSFLFLCRRRHDPRLNDNAKGNVPLLY